MSATGVAIWVAVRPGRTEIHTRTIYPKGADWSERLQDLTAQFNELIIAEKLDAVAIEDTMRIIPRCKADSLKKLFTATGALMATCLAAGIRPRMVDKGRMSKQGANMVVDPLMGRAERCSQHARDAVLVGYLAGFQTYTPSGVRDATE